MILLLAIWIVLFALALVHGAAILQLARCVTPVSAGDRFFLAAWTGILTIGVLLLYASMVIPLGGGAAAALAAWTAWLVVRHRGLRRELSAYRRLFTPARVAIGCALALGTAYATVDTICNRDVLSYHLDNIHAMSRIGLAPGLGLIYPRYGFVSSWFAIPALFNHGPMTMRIAPAANGFVGLLMLGQLHMSASRILRRQGTASDWFVSAALVLSSIFPIYLNQLVSTTPDFPFILGTVIVAWASWIVYDRSPARPACAAAGLPLLPVYLSACLFAVKMSALPLLAAVGGLYLFHQRFRIRAWIAAAAAILPPVGSLAAAATLMTGYPLFPASWGFDLPWTLNPHQWPFTKTHWGQQGAIEAPYPSMAWLREWLRLGTDTRIGFIFFLAAVACLIWILTRHRTRLRSVASVLLIGVAGVVFLMIKVPSARFAWAYVSIIMSAPAILHVDVLNRWADRLSIPRSAHLLLPAGLAVVILGLGVGGKTESERRVAEALRAGRLEPDRTPRWLAPPIPYRLVFDDERRSVEVYREHEDNPSAYLHGPRAMRNPLLLREGIRYRDPGAGVRGGFMRDDGL